MIAQILTRPGLWKRFGRSIELAAMYAWAAMVWGASKLTQEEGGEGGGRTGGDEGGSSGGGSGGGGGSGR